MKKRREMEENRNDIPTPIFEDKYKKYNQDYINNKIAQRKIFFFSTETKKAKIWLRAI